MCTIVKVKRKTTDEAPECLIFQCKKKKLNSELDKSDPSMNGVESVVNGNNSDSFKQVFRYAGTGENDVNDILIVIS